MHGIAIALVFAGCTVFAVLAMLAFLRIWRTESPARSVCINVTLFLISLAYVTLALETYFYLFPQSDGFAFTLGSKRWHALYDGPINALGYRDREHTAGEFHAKNSLLIVGDSFAAGSGIADYRNRFADVLVKKLGDAWAVANVSRGGWDTTNELDALAKYPHPASHVILQYYTNDVKHAAVKHGLALTPPVPWPDQPLLALITHSYLADAVYWRLFRKTYAPFLAAFEDRRHDAYQNPAVWDDHERALRDFAKYAADHRIQLLVLIFPSLFRVEADRPNTARVAAVFESMNLPVLDLTPLAAERKPLSMTCNIYNGHPNEAFSREVAALLFDKMKSIGWLDAH